LVNASARIAKLISKDLLVEANINEEHFAGIQTGQKATVRFLSYGNQMFEGVVSRVLPAADAVTQEYSVYLNIPNMNKPLMPGLSGEASIIKARRDNALIIPRRALLGSYVFRVEDDVVRMVKVAVGFKSLNKAEILSGLEEGDIIITDEHDRFFDGDSVDAELP